jgi:hypothetical protein
VRWNPRGERWKNHNKRLHLLLSVEFSNSWDGTRKANQREPQGAKIQFVQFILAAKLKCDAIGAKTTPDGIREMVAEARLRCDTIGRHPRSAGGRDALVVTPGFTRSAP